MESRTAGEDRRGEEPPAPPSTSFVDRLARAIHEDYVRRRRADPDTQPNDPATRDWADLDESLKESNRDQALDIERKLAAIGCRVVAAQGVRPVDDLTDDEVEELARLEHLRWVEHRRRQGWRSGPERDTAAKVTPYLVPWSGLSEKARDLDRDAVRAIPRLLAQSGLTFVRMSARDEG